MKKLFLLLSLVATLVFTGCDNDNSVNPQPMGKATISGIVRADFDLNNNGGAEGKTWDAVANTKLNVIVWNNNGDLVRTIEVTTDGSGAYTFDVEVGNLPLDVKITPVDFRHDVKISDTVTDKNVVFEGVSKDKKVYKGGSYIVDFDY